MVSGVLELLLLCSHPTHRKKFMVASLVGEVGLQVPAAAGAEFYADTLGGMRRAGSANVNVGDSQIRFLDSCEGADAESDEPKPWAGHLELWTREPLGQLLERLQRWEFPPLPNLIDHSADGDPRILCTCPWGNKLVVRPAHQAHEVRGEPPGGSGVLVAISRVVCAVPTGTTRAIHAFWISILGCAADHRSLPGGLIAFTIAHIGSGQQLVFEERRDEADEDEDTPAPKSTALAPVPTEDDVAAPPASAGRSPSQMAIVYIQSREAFRTAYMSAASKHLLDGAQTWSEVETASEFRVHPTVHGRGARLGVVLCLRSITHDECPKHFGRRVGAGRLPGGFGARARELASSAASAPRPASASAPAGVAPLSGRPGSASRAGGRGAAAVARRPSPASAVASRTSPRAPSRGRKRSPSLGADSAAS